MRTSRILVLSLFSLLHHFSTADHHSAKKLPPSVMVIGAVVCNSCFHQEFSMSKSHSISGATVAIQCPSFRKEVKTNKHGVFRALIPHGTIKTCSVKLVKSSEPLCAEAAAAASTEFRQVQRRRNGDHVFSSGLFTFKPASCYQKLEVGDQKRVHPSFFFLPPPIFPSPSIGGIPLPPNPLLPPPSILPPLQPPPSLLPPLPFQPPPPTFLGIIPPLPSIPPLPLLTPPPPPPPTVFPGFPPIPFVPLFLVSHLQLLRELLHEWCVIFYICL